jgi:hypothetical protein
LMKMKRRMERDGLKAVLREYDPVDLPKLLEDIERELESRGRQE